jgi:hypothetical protein
MYLLITCLAPLSTSETDKPPSSIGERYKIDPKTILATSHGRRSIDVFAEIDPTNATWDCKSLLPISLSRLTTY